MNLKERAVALKRDVPAVFLALKAGETPLPAKLLAFLTVAYALSPIDLIPDFIPVLGYIDDLVILPALIACCVKCIPDEVFSRCRKRAKGMWDGSVPTKWYYAIPFALVWIVLIALLVAALL